MVSNTPLLDTVTMPADTRGMALGQLRQLADEVRAEMIDAVSTTGGHLGAGLGVVELTVALHHVFETPRDILIWDVGHQAYPHKIITGRRDRIRTLRQGGGLSGFTKRSESEYDPFGTAHSSTSISAALGFAIANKMAGTPGKGIAVIGDQSNYAQAGALFSYGASQADLFRRAAGYVVRILRGEKAADLPVQLPTAIEFVVNLRTARALGLAMPQAILARADDVIE